MSISLATLPLAGGLAVPPQEKTPRSQSGTLRVPSSPPTPKADPSTPEQTSAFDKFKIHQIAMRVVKVAELQRRLRHRKLAPVQDEEQIAALSGIRLENVLAFRSLVSATKRAIAASVPIGEKDPLLGRTTLALSIFNIPTEAQRRVTDKDRWRRLFPAARGERPGGGLTLLFLALMAEACRRFDEADVYVIQLLVRKASRLEELTEEERTCVQRAFNRRIQRSKHSLKQVAALERAFDARRDVGQPNRTYRLAEVAAYKERLKDDIVRHCYAIVWAVTHLIMPSPGSPATQMFSYKWIATAFRQVTQLTDSVPQYQCLQLAESNFQQAVNVAKTDMTLRPCDMLRIETLISWANFLFYNLDKRQEALASARETLQEAIAQLATVPEEHFAEVVEALQILMKSIWRWNQESRKGAMYDWWSSL